MSSRMNSCVNSKSNDVYIMIHFQSDDPSVGSSVDPSIDPSVGSSVDPSVDPSVGSYRKVVLADESQQIAFNNYIENGFLDLVEYGSDSEACFSIGPFDYAKMGLTGNYNDIYCIFTHTTDNLFLLISCNYPRLSGLCGFLNRVYE